ncbi:MAG TPA: hypothetical protein VLH79_12350 [Chthonomonadales bacterium]|nr:hypothetical protein [Chthonomonadales bacterium]
MAAARAADRCDSAPCLSERARRAAELADILADRFPQPMERAEKARRVARLWAGRLTWAVAISVGFAAGWVAGASGGPPLVAAYLLGAACLLAWASSRWAAACLEPLCEATLREASSQRRAAAAAELGAMPCRSTLLALTAAAERERDPRVRAAARSALAPSVAAVVEADFRTDGGLGARLAALLSASPRATAGAILEAIERFDAGAAHPAVKRAAKRHPDAEVRAAAARVEPVVGARSERLRLQRTLLRASARCTQSLLRPAPLLRLVRPADPPSSHDRMGARTDRRRQRAAQASPPASARRSRRRTRPETSL